MRARTRHRSCCGTITTDSTGRSDDSNPTQQHHNTNTNGRGGSSAVGLSNLRLLARNRRGGGVAGSSAGSHAGASSGGGVSFDDTPTHIAAGAESPARASPTLAGAGAVGGGKERDLKRHVQLHDAEDDDSDDTSSEDGDAPTPARPVRRPLAVRGRPPATASSASSAAAGGGAGSGSGDSGGDEPVSPSAPGTNSSSSSGLTPHHVSREVRGAVPPRLVRMNTTKKKALRPLHRPPPIHWSAGAFAITFVCSLCPPLAWLLYRVRRYPAVRRNGWFGWFGKWLLLIEDDKLSRIPQFKRVFMLLTTLHLIGVVYLYNRTLGKLDDWADFSAYSWIISVLNCALLASVIAVYTEGGSKGYEQTMDAQRAHLTSLKLSLASAEEVVTKRLARTGRGFLSATPTRPRRRASPALSATAATATTLGASAGTGAAFSATGAPHTRADSGDSSSSSAGSSVTSPTADQLPNGSGAAAGGAAAGGGAAAPGANTTDADEFPPHARGMCAQIQVIVNRKKRSLIKERLRIVVILAVVRGVLGIVSAFVDAYIDDDPAQAAAQAAAILPPTGVGVIGSAISSALWALYNATFGLVLSHPFLTPLWNAPFKLDVMLAIPMTTVLSVALDVLMIAGLYFLQGLVLFSVSVLLESELHEDLMRWRLFDILASPHRALEQGLPYYIPLSVELNAESLAQTAGGGGGSGNNSGTASRDGVRPREASLSASTTLYGADTPQHHAPPNSARRPHASIFEAHVVSTDAFRAETPISASGLELAAAFAPRGLDGTRRIGSLSSISSIDEEMKAPFSRSSSLGSTPEDMALAAAASAAMSAASGGGGGANGRVAVAGGSNSSPLLVALQSNPTATSHHAVISRGDATPNASPKPNAALGLAIGTAVPAAGSRRGSLSPPLMPTSPPTAPPTAVTTARPFAARDTYLGAVNTAAASSPRTAVPPFNPLSSPPPPPLARPGSGSSAAAAASPSPHGTAPVQRFVPAPAAEQPLSAAAIAAAFAALNSPHPLARAPSSTSSPAGPPGPGYAGPPGPMMPVPMVGPPAPPVPSPLSNISSDAATSAPVSPADAAAAAVAADPNAAAVASAPLFIHASVSQPPTPMDIASPAVRTPTPPSAASASSTEDGTPSVHAHAGMGVHRASSAANLHAHTAALAAAATAAFASASAPAASSTTTAAAAAAAAPATAAAAPVAASPHHVQRDSFSGRFDPSQLQGLPSSQSSQASSHPPHGPLSRSGSGLPLANGNPRAAAGAGNVTPPLDRHATLSRSNSSSVAAANAADMESDDVVCRDTRNNIKAWMGVRSYYLEWKGRYDFARMQVIVLILVVFVLMSGVTMNAWMVCEVRLVIGFDTLVLLFIISDVVKIAASINRIRISHVGLLSRLYFEQSLQLSNIPHVFAGADAAPAAVARERRVSHAHRIISDLNQQIFAASKCLEHNKYRETLRILGIPIDGLIQFLRGYAISYCIFFLKTASSSTTTGATSGSGGSRR